MKTDNELLNEYGLAEERALTSGKKYTELDYNIQLQPIAEIGWTHDEIKSVNVKVRMEEMKIKGAIENLIMANDIIKQNYFSTIEYYDEDPNLRLGDLKVIKIDSLRGVNDK